MHYFLIRSILTQQTFSFGSIITIIFLIACVIIIMVVGNNKHEKGDWASEIEQFYGNRIRSRLRESFNLIAFNNNSRDKRK